ncbi:MAG: type 1 glutamine amidotransferase domain-containing protein [Rhizobacter sp.]
MPEGHQLKGRRIAVLAADGFERVELSVPVAALRAAGAEVDIVSLRPGRIRGVNLHEPAARVTVDRTLSQASVSDYDALLVPGGFINPDLLRQSEAARQFVREFDASGKPIATLCHGPWLLSSAGLTQGRTMTSWPGVRDDLVNAGATWLDQEVVVDGNWLTSRGPQDIVPFVKALLDHFAAGHLQRQAHAADAAERTSAPQRNAPPALVLGVMKWMPRPSLRTAVMIGAALAFYAAKGGRRHGPGRRSHVGTLQPG